MCLFLLWLRRCQCHPGGRPRARLEFLQCLGGCFALLQQLAQPKECFAVLLLGQMAPLLQHAQMLLQLVPLEGPVLPEVATLEEMEQLALVHQRFAAFTELVQAKAQLQPLGLNFWVFFFNFL